MMSNVSSNMTFALRHPFPARVMASLAALVVAYCLIPTAAKGWVIPVNQTKTWVPGSESFTVEAESAVKEVVADPDLESLLTNDDESASAEQKAAVASLAGLLRTQSLQRQPAAVLKGLKERQIVADGKIPPDAKQPATDDEKTKMSPLTVRVLTGDWKAVKEVLAELPKEQGPPVYTALLAMLLGDPSGVILPSDVAALADAAPAELNDQHLALLGHLVRRSLDQSEKPGALLAALRSGTSRLGGEDPARRVAAAKVLLAARLLDEAAGFLPPVEAALSQKDASLVNLHARHQFLVGNERSDKKAIVRSWELTLAVLEIPNADAAVRAAATRRTLALLPELPRETASSWFQKEFRGDAAKSLEMLSDVAGRVARSFKQRQAGGRVSALRLQHLAGTELLAARKDDLGQWSLPLEMLTRGWINEAQKAVGGSLRRIVVEDDEKVEPLPIPTLLELAPGPAWRSTINTDTADHVRHLLGTMLARTGDRSGTLALIREIVARDPKLARQIAEALIVPDAGAKSEMHQEEYYSHMQILQQLHPSQRAAYQQQYMHQSHAMPGQEGQPTTRAGQLRQLSRLKELLAALKEAGVPPLEDASVVTAFQSCHSPAEVFRVEDVERVFGKLDKLGVDASLQLAQALRLGLAGIWRDPDVQQQGGTKRAPRDQMEEVNRGYALAKQLLGRAADRAPQRVDVRTVLAGVYFDQAEFLYEQQVELKTYVTLRETAFKLFRAAAEEYARGVGSLDPERYNIDVYRQWFQAALGASDLAVLTRQDEPDKTQIERIATALSSLAKPAAEKHVQLFAESMIGSLEHVPPQLKPHVVRQAIRVVGAHPAGRPLAHRLGHYDDILKEIELSLTIDGSERVGRGRPFGVHVSLRGTKAVFRENNAFVEFLSPASAPTYISHHHFAVPPPAADADEPRKLLEREIREKLAQAFDVEGLVFHAPTGKPRSCGREGWQELPVAYAILRAKDGAVDRLPPVQVDVNFADGVGEVRLPIRSQVVLLDAREANPQPRPASNVKVRQVLDDRELAEGVLKLELTATARGLVPELDVLLQGGELSATGFETARTVDHGLSVTSLDAGEDVAALTERKWLFELVPVEGETPGEFLFPALADGSFAASYQRFDDMDIVDANQSTPLRRPALDSVRQWVWLASAVGATGLLVVTGLVVIARRRRSRRPPAPAYRWPEPITPFSVLTVLRRMQRDNELDLSPAERGELSEIVARLEQRFFARAAHGDSPDLEFMLAQWLPRTGAANGSHVPIS